MVQEMSYFGKAFKKLKYIESKKGKLIKKYLEEPVETLKEVGVDKDLVALLEKNVETLNLSNKRKERTLEGIKKIKSGVLDRVLEEYKETENKISKIEREINSITTINEKIRKESEYKNCKMEIEELDQRVEELKRETDKVEITRKREALEKNLRELTGKKVNVKVS